PATDPPPRLSELDGREPRAILRSRDVTADAGMGQRHDAADVDEGADRVQPQRDVHRLSRRAAEDRRPDAPHPWRQRRVGAAGRDWTPDREVDSWREARSLRGRASWIVCDTHGTADERPARLCESLRDGFLRADKGTHDAAVDLRERRFVRQSSFVEGLSHVIRSVDSRRLDVDLLASGVSAFLAALLYLERARDAADPELHAAANGVGNVVSTHHDVGHSQTTAWLEDAERLCHDPILVGGQVDHAVRNDHVDRVVG